MTKLPYYSPALAMCPFFIFINLNTKLRYSRFPSKDAIKDTRNAYLLMNFKKWIT